MQESGFFEKFKREWMKFSSECTKMPPPSSASLHISALSGIFMLVGVMSGVALIVLCLECFIFQKRRDEKEYIFQKKQLKIKN